MKYVFKHTVLVLVFVSVTIYNKVICSCANSSS